MTRYIRESNRVRLEDSDISNLRKIDSKLSDRVGYLFPPLEAIVLDEDTCSNTLIRLLEKRDLKYKNHSLRPISMKSKIEVVNTSHIFDTTDDRALLKWCHRHSFPLVTCNSQDFLDLHKNVNDHSGLIVNIADTSSGFKDSGLADTIQRILADNTKPEIMGEIYPIKA